MNKNVTEGEEEREEKTKEREEREERSKERKAEEPKRKEEAQRFLSYPLNTLPEQKQI